MSVQREVALREGTGSYSCSSSSTNTSHFENVSEDHVVVNIFSFLCVEEDLKMKNVGRRKASDPSVIARLLLNNNSLNHIPVLPSSLNP